MLRICAYIFDCLRHFWDKPDTERGIGLTLVWVYLITLLAAELQRQGHFPSWLPQVPPSHFFSIQLAFTLILALEVLGLIFILPSSFSKCMGKQLEILTLILLRNAFKELSILPEPIYVNMNNLDQIVDIAISGLGALCVFLCLGFYRKIAQRQNFMRDPQMIEKYVRTKKALSLCLLLIFAGIGSRDLILFLQGVKIEFFETIYTVLIFADIAMVLISQRYMPSYNAVFRNSGFVIGTLMMRLALSAPPLLCAGLAVFSAVYVIALTWGTDFFRSD